MSRQNAEFMRPDIKARWVEALRSGRYVQTKGNLNNIEDGKECFCCLGVLCEIALQDGQNTDAKREVYYVNDPANPSKGDRYVGGYTYFTARNFLPDPIREWAHLRSADPAVDDPNGPGLINLSKLNDEGASFNEIADLIEKDL